MTASERTKTMQSSPIAHLRLVSPPAIIVGIALIALTHSHVLRLSFETLLQFAAIIGALAIMFGYAEERRWVTVTSIWRYPPSNWVRSIL